MARQLSSRRAQIEERRARRNLIISFVVILTLGVLFLVFVIPLVFRVVVQVAQRGSEAVVANDTIPPQRPVFQPPEKFLKQKAFSLNGFTEAKAKVELVINGQIVATSEADDDGHFLLETTLEEGEHELLVTASDAAGNLSQSSNYPVTIDTTAPSLRITSPENNTTFTVRSEQVVSITGSLSEKGSVRAGAARTSTNDDGEFTARLTLNEGENKIEVVGVDQAGNESAKTELTLRYEP